MDISGNLSYFPILKLVCWFPSKNFDGHGDLSLDKMCLLLFLNHLVI